MYFVMKDESEIPGKRDAPKGSPSDQSSQALNTALQKTFDSLLQEPVPDKLQDLIARIREEELRKTGDSGKSDDSED